MSRECKNEKKDEAGSSKPNTRAFALTADQAKRDPDVVSGTFLVNGITASVLFDSGASRSFVSTSFVRLAKLESCDVPEIFSVDTASDRSVKVKRMIKECRIELEGCVFTATLYIISLGGFDVVLGMDSLAENDA